MPHFFRKQYSLSKIVLYWKKCMKILQFCISLHNGRNSFNLPQGNVDTEIDDQNKFFVATRQATARAAKLVVGR